MSQPALSPSLVRALIPLAIAPFASAQGLVDTARRYVEPLEGRFQHLADLDGDLDDDAVWFQDAPGPDTAVLGFRAYFNDGGGELGQPGPLVSFPGTGYFSLNSSGLRRLADVTGDGIADMVAGSSIYVPQTSSTISTLHLYPALLPGVFGPPISVPLGGALRGAALGNVDADAAREIAVVEYVVVSTFQRSEVIAWYDWNGTGLTRSPQAVATGSLDKQPTMLAALDLEGDGDSDLVYGRSNAQALRMAITSGGAPGPVSFLSLPLAQPAWLGPHPCDLEGGGVEDLLVACTRGNASFALVPVLNQAGLLVAEEEQDFVARWGEVYGSSFRVGDWDDDGDGDVLYYGWQEPGSSTEGIVAFYENDGANDFGAGPVALVETNDPPASDSFPGCPVDPSDLDRDGRLDFVLPHSVQFGRGRFEPALVPITDTFFGPTPIGLFDHEGDGDLDLFLGDPFFFTGGLVALNDGTGAFGERLLPPPPPHQRERIGIAGIGDFSGDGRTDFLAGIFIPPATIFDTHVFEEVRLYEDDGLGGFRDAGRASTESMLSPDRQTNLTNDLDEDGDLDVLGRFVGGWGYWPNGGRGTFAAFEPLIPGCCTIPSALGDLDANGRVDVVTGSFSPMEVIAWKNRAPRGRVRSVEGRAPEFDPTRVFQAAQGSFDSESVNLADHDADGDLDLAFSSTPGIRLFVNDGTGAFSPGASLVTDLVPGPEPWISRMAFEDLDDDGHVDLLSGAEHNSGEYPRAVAVFRGLGAGAFEAARTYAGGIMGDPGDLDGDGDLDLSGVALVRSLRFDGPEDGRIRQYGTGTAGSGGAVPVLGATGPLRIGSSSAEIRLRRARGGSRFALFFSLSPGTGPAVPHPGAPTLLGPPILARLYATLGAPGQAGAGRFDLELGPVLPLLAGHTVYFQAGLVDPGAASGFALSNGLALTFGS